MSAGAFDRLGQRMAARNNLTLFAWIAAILLPWGLQLFAGYNEEVRLYLAGYYGPFTLYFFFVMTYGFAAVFVCFYQLSAYRRQGTLDMLRIARLTPWEVLRDVYLQLQRVLLPPIGGFLVVFGVYLLLSPERSMLRGLGGGAIFGGVLNVMLTEMLLSAIICLGLLRGEAALAALSALLILPLNIAPIALMFAAERWRDRYMATVTLNAPLQKVPFDSGREGWERISQAQQMPWLLDWYTSYPWLFYTAGMMLVIALVLWTAHRRLARLWPPQVSMK